MTENENNNVVLSQELSELVSELKAAQTEVELLLSKTITSELKRSFHKFEKLVSKTSEIENFNTQLSLEERMKLRTILSDIKTTFLKYQDKTGYIQNQGYPEKSAENTLVRKTDFDILVFGLEATGKKSLAKAISDDPDYKDFRKASKFKFNVKIINIDDLGTLENICSSKKPFGIVNVVSYGYVFPKHLKYEDIVAPGKILEDYLEERRKEELNLLKDFLSGLQDAKRCWFVTLISKADLWHQQRGQVEKYYQEGEYADMFKQVSVKANNFAHRYVPASLVLLNAYSSDHKLLAYVESGCDGLFKDESINKLFGAMEDLSSIF